MTNLAFMAISWLEPWHLWAPAWAALYTLCGVDSALTLALGMVPGVLGVCLNLRETSVRM